MSLQNLFLLLILGGAPWSRTLFRDEGGQQLRRGAGTLLATRMEAHRSFLENSLSLPYHQSQPRLHTCHHVNGCNDKKKEGCSLTPVKANRFLSTLVRWFLDENVHPPLRRFQIVGRRVIALSPSFLHYLEISLPTYLFPRTTSRENGWRPHSMSG